MSGDSFLEFAPIDFERHNSFTGATMAIENVGNVSVGSSNFPWVGSPDQKLAARVASIIRSATAGAGFSKAYIYASVDGGVVTLFGAAPDRATVREIEAAVRKQAGCAVIQNRIRTMRRYVD